MPKTEEKEKSIDAKTSTNKFNCWQVVSVWNTRVCACDFLLVFFFLFRVVNAIKFFSMFSFFSTQSTEIVQLRLLFCFPFLVQSEALKTQAISFHLTWWIDGRSNDNIDDEEDSDSVKNTFICLKPILFLNSIMLPRPFDSSFFSGSTSKCVTETNNLF